MQTMLDACWNTLSQVEFRLLWSIPLVLAISGLFFWSTRKAAIRPLGSRVHRLQRYTAGARESAASLAAVERVVAQELRDQLNRLDDSSRDAKEMGVLARQTAGAAAEVATLAETNRKTAECSAAALSEVIDALEQTRAGFQETSGLIQALDEMAVRTNLLALGAAVEASRGGASAAAELLAEIAAEMNDVAVRSAEAARVGEQILERTLKHNLAGESLAGGLRSGLVELDAAGGRIARLSHEVSAAEKEKSSQLALLSQSLADSHRALELTAAGAYQATTLSDEICGQTARAGSLARELAEQIGSTPLVLPGVADSTSTTAPALAA